MARPTFLLWLDLETTGLDPHHDEILETACYFTYFADPFFTLADEAWFHRVEPKTNWTGVDPVVLDMHGKSGLVVDCVRATRHPRTLEGDLLERFGDLTAPIVLAGSSVHFDLGFLRSWCPGFARLLSHRVYDVSAIKMFCQSIGMPDWPKEETAHRAIQDVQASVRIAQRCHEFLNMHTKSEIAKEIVK